MSPEYAWCRHCGGLIRLRGDGTYRKHKLPIQAGRNPVGRALDCPCSWTYPDTSEESVRGVEDVPDPGGRFG